MNDFTCSIKQQPNFIEVPFKWYFKIFNKRERQLEIEKYLIGKALCSQINPDIYQDIKFNNYKIDIKKLDEILSSPLTVISRYHEFISCYINSIIEKDDVNNILSPTQIEKIRDFIPTLELLEVSSAEGYVSRANVKYISNDMFVIKTPQDIYHNLIHEVMIGVLALNNLKKYIPNFMYVYGYFSCSQMVLYGENVLTWCSDSGNSDVNYTILENVKDSLQFKKWITLPEITVHDFLSVFYQLLNALNVAHFKYSYSHNDLHAGNVLVRKFKNKITIPFYNSKGKIIKYIVSNYVPYIIDYGFNYIKLNDINGKPYEFGLIRYIAQDINYDETFPLVDIYKLICFGSSHLYKNEGDTGIIKVMEKMFTFFSTEETLRGRIKKWEKDYDDYFVPNNSFSKYSYYDFINWMENNEFDYKFVLSLNDIKNNKILLPKENQCNFIDIVSENPEISVVEYCELMTDIDHQVNNFKIDFEEGRRMKNSVFFDAEVNFINDREIMDRIKEYIINLDLENVEGEEKDKNFFIIKEEIFYLESLVKSNECALIYQNNYYKKEYREYIRSTYIFIDKIKEILDNQYKKLQFF